MDVQDFEMPSPKRQRTNSEPEEPKPVSQATSMSTSEAATKVAQDLTTAGSVATELDPTKQEPDMLDFLMQHVESESKPTIVQQDHLTMAPPIPLTEANADTDMTEAHDGIPGLGEPEVEAECKGEDILVSGDRMNAASSQSAAVLNPARQDATVVLEQESQQQDQVTSVLAPGIEAAPPTATSLLLKDAPETNALPPTAETLLQEHMPAPSNGTAPDPTEQAAEGPEWEVDSSPYSSDSSDTTDSSDDSDDSDDADGYTLLDPIEQARILMAEDGGGGGADSDDEEGGSRRTAKVPSSLRTANEKIEAILPKPDVSVSSSTSISELGTVTFFVENTLVITAKTSGEYQVLESGSVLCLGPPSYSVIGAVAETLGRVEEPLYTVRFASDTDVRDSFGLSALPNPSKGTDESQPMPGQEPDQELEIDTRPLQDQLKNIPIFYVNDHSTFVFTQPLKASKGTDASNIHDEEVGDDEMEFSDDEAEAEHKRLAKLRRKGIDPNSAAGQRGGRGGTRGAGQRGGRGGGRGAPFSYQSSSHVSETYNPSDNVEMNYDDVEEGEMTTDYAPLRRPESFQHGQSNSYPEKQGQSPGQTQRRGGRGARGMNYTTSRGGRGRGTGHGRGNYQPHPQSQNANYSQSQNHNQQITGYQSNQYQDANNGNNFNYNHNSQLFNPTTPSSMYAFPRQQQQQQQQNQQLPLPPPPPPASFQPTVPSTNFDFQAQAQAQWMQYHANQTQQFQQQQQQLHQQYGAQPGFNINAESLAQVQRQLDEMRRNAGQNYQQ